MNIALLAAGAAGMYCGSCLRDNALAVALLRAGHKVMLIPLYTPLRTDSKQPAEVSEVFYGAVNAYLQTQSSIFRHTPRFLDWLLDRPRLLTWAGKMGTSTPPAQLARFTCDVLLGDEGKTHKELRRLVGFLKRDVKPQVVSLPNLMFIGMAGLIRRELNVPVVCELTGEDIFLDAMSDADRATVREIIRERTTDIARFVATSSYYARQMTEYLHIPPEKISVVPMGIPESNIQSVLASSARPRSVAYIARLCPEKGLDGLLAAMKLVRQMPGLIDARVEVAGYLSPGNRAWYESLQADAENSNLKGAVTWHGEVSREKKFDILDNTDLLCVPTAYPEAKGLYVLEAFARARPVVLPDHGAFPELVARTGGGLLAPAADSRALAEKIAELLLDDMRRRAMGATAQQVVRAEFTDDRMATGMLAVYSELLEESRRKTEESR